MLSATEAALNDRCWSAAVSNCSLKTSSSRPTSAGRRFFRALPLPFLVVLMLVGMRIGIQAELDVFFGHLQFRARTEHYGVLCRNIYSCTYFSFLIDYLGLDFS
jgi:hypothetical protein